MSLVPKDPAVEVLKLVQEIEEPELGQAMPIVAGCPLRRGLAMDGRI